MNVVVQLRDARLDIWTGTQIPPFLVAGAASVTGLRAENIHLHAQMSGGSFGRRLEDDYVRQAIELAKAFPGHPIKMTWTREECPPSALVGQIRQIEEGSVSGSS
jgi:isoquinoline 1-oxidoreductase subunit beta